MEVGVDGDLILVVGVRHGEGVYDVYGPIGVFGSQERADDARGVGLAPVVVLYYGEEHERLYGGVGLAVWEEVCRGHVSRLEEGVGCGLCVERGRRGELIHLRVLHRKYRAKMTRERRGEFWGFWVLGRVQKTQEVGIVPRFLASLEFWFL